MFGHGEEMNQIHLGSLNRLYIVDRNKVQKENQFK